MDFVFAPAPTPVVPVIGTTAQFPVRRIYCVGRNYADHSREMGHDPNAAPPFFFCKPADTITVGDAPLPFPSMCSDLHYEGELVVALGSGGQDLTVAEAEAAVFGFAVGNDITRRDLQSEAKALCRPWDLSKGAEGGAVVGPITPVAQTSILSMGRLQSFVNGVLRQEGDLSQMIWPVGALIANLSQFVTLSAGDLIYTGTPAGVGSIVRGDKVRVEIQGLIAIETEIL